MRACEIIAPVASDINYSVMYKKRKRILSEVRKVADRFRLRVSNMEDQPVINNDFSRVENSFLTLLVVLTAVAIKMAFISNAGFVILYLGAVAAAVIVYINKNIENGNEK